jgi:hypothetical protein
MAAAQFTVHPGWRGRVPTAMEVVTDQSTALSRIVELIDAQLWSPRQRREWTAMLSAMVHAMDWHTGLVVGVSRDRLAQLTGRSVTTVSRLWAWAEGEGLLARVEEGASREWLGTAEHRTAAFVFVRPRRHISVGPPSVEDSSFPQLTTPVDQNGNPPASCVTTNPLERLNHSQSTYRGPWATFAIPSTPSQRQAAATLYLNRAGLGGTRIDARRLHGLLKPWWTAGICVAGLFWMLDHHPDEPEKTRGDAVRGARDPVAVIGSRLAPWAGRTSELPSAVQGRRGDYQAAQQARLQHRLTRAHTTAALPHCPTAGADVRAAAQAALRAHLEHLRTRAHASRRTPVSRAQRWPNPPRGTRQ